MVIPVSLQDGELAALWRRVGERLDARGHTWRGRMTVPELSPRGRHLAGSLLGGRVRRTVDLNLLESALVDRGVGKSLPEALSLLGYPVSARLVELRQRRRVAASARDAALSVVGEWPEAWAPVWFDAAWRSGAFRSMDPADAVAFVGQTRLVLDAVGRSQAQSWSRTQLAAAVLGSAHALDRGTRLEAVVARAMAMRDAHDFDRIDRNEIWDLAGAPVDTLSAPALTWRMPMVGDGAVAIMVRTATDAGIAMHMSVAMLRRMPVEFDADSTVLVVENPRVLEAAMERGSDLAMVCGNGNPSTAVCILLACLRDAGVKLLYHGDFDSAGLGIAARLQAKGCHPWKMGAPDYLAALDRAEQEGVELPVDERPVPATPWDPELAKVFADRRKVVHEERLIDSLLTPLHPA